MTIGGKILIGLIVLINLGNYTLIAVKNCKSKSSSNFIINPVIMQQMEQLFKVVKELEGIRGLPQFIFIAGIRHKSMLSVRQEIQKFTKKNPDKKEIDFILESPGGNADYAYVLIRTLREHFEKVNIIVAFWAKSAATLSALGGSTIIMDEFGEFGPLDVQLSTDEELPDSEPQSGLIDEIALKTIENRSVELYERMLLKLLKKNNSRDIDIRLKKTILSKQVFEYISNLYKPLFEQVDPYKIGEKTRSLAIAERYAERILKQYNEENLKENVHDFVDYMVHDCPNHGYNIDYSIMSIFLANVYKSSDISEDYFKALTKLSILFYTNPGKYEYIGFFDKKILEKVKKIKDTKEEAINKPELPKEAKEEKKDEKQERKK
ncbi:hypothetical protein A2160_01970 [Candidatus Beckwithbacteria bacterium RBG_13_42_9]|uniref:Peptidase S49 domain-containing protein n=1 Tax=Candidatus Beckwithbacteria bacterium RBG_13_42_9 TaxID=1797457 RepID=A0A1F5E874_9BACT|nr:MAG: hypothetical protein A2160_01970 [Candidatus Beckwithbacteria bacterium RBG_13_42_9]